MRGLQVLISGVSPGFEMASAVFLGKNGFRVFAGVQNVSVGNIPQKNTPGKIDPLFLDVLDSKCGKGLSIFNEIMRESDNEVTHLASDLNSHTAIYSLNSSSIPSENVTNSVHQKLIPKNPESRYFFGKYAIFLKLKNSIPDKIRNRFIITIMKIWTNDYSCSNVHCTRCNESTF